MNNWDWRLIDAAQIHDNGAVISSAGYVTDNWYKATVPGTVLTTLVDNGVYPDPLFGENMRDIPESLNKASYWYRAQFTVPADAHGRKVWLQFEGINYMAEVWVAGEFAGEIKGAFARGNFDITDFVAPGQPGAVAVRILPLNHPGTPHEHTWELGNGKNGGDTAADGPTFCCTVGWDWLPAIRDRAMGIWQDVSLVTTGPVVIEDPYVLSDLPVPALDSADLTLKLTLRNTTDQSQSAVLTGSYDGAVGFEMEVSLPARAAKEMSLTPRELPQLHIDSPRVWWPNGYGDPNLYTMRLSLETTEGISDSREIVFGIRKIEYAVAGSDILTLCVNGVPVVCKGGNWALDDGMKQLPRERLDAQVHLHKLANSTMIRNWVGQSTAKYLYEMCDKHGLLLWDEFFQPNPHDGPDPVDNQLYLANVREKILRFRSHACVALWCGRNEGNPPPDLDNGNELLVARLDPTRLYQSSSTSGHGVLSHGPYRWRTPREFYVIPHGEKEAFKTEIGTVSVPTLEAVRAMLPEKDWYGLNDAWAQHDLCRGAQRGDEYGHHMTQRYGKPDSLEDFVGKAQLMNYESYRAMYEGRLVKLFDPVTGILTWMSHPAQPSMVWQYYSYDLEAHASLFGTRKGCEPVHVMLNEESGNVFVVNSLPEPLAGCTATAEIHQLSGEKAAEQRFNVDAPGCRAVDLGPLALPEGLSQVYFVRLKLDHPEGDTISENFYWRAAPGADPDDLTALNGLPPVALDFATSLSGDGDGKTWIDVTVANPSESTVALMAHLQLRRDRSGERVLPVYCSENYISILPGESKALTAEFAAENLAGEEPVFALDGWNVAVGTVSGPIGVIPNPQAAELHPWGDLPPAFEHRHINPTA